jgi:hypothetical protein
MYYNSSIHFFTIIIITYYRIMTVRKIIREWGALSEAERLLSKAGRLLSELVLPGHPYHNKNT